MRDISLLLEKFMVVNQSLIDFILFVSIETSNLKDGHIGDRKRFLYYRDKAIRRQPCSLNSLPARPVVPFLSVCCYGGGRAREHGSGPPTCRQ